MANNRHIPAEFGINRYLWAKLSEEGLMKTLGGIIPIVPVEEVPEIMRAIEEEPGITSAPYIVYNWNSNGYEQTYWNPTDQAVYLISSPSQKVLRQIILLFNDHLKRYDESAQAVNDYIAGSGLSEEYHKYDYKWIQVQGLSGGVPIGEENEPSEAQVTIRLSYTYDGDSLNIKDL